MTCAPEAADRVAKPRNFDEMVDVAERLSRGFGFLRIDLYNVDGRVFFGEVTCTPAGGVSPIANAARSARSARFAAKWKLARDDRRLYQTDPSKSSTAA